jgi:hypothetical protein
MKKEDNGAVPLSSRRRPTTSSGSKKGGEEAEAEAEADVGAAADCGRANSAARSLCRRGRRSRESQQHGAQLVEVGARPRRERVPVVRVVKLPPRVALVLGTILEGDGLRGWIAARTSARALASTWWASVVVTVAVGPPR